MPRYIDADALRDEIVNYFGDLMIQGRHDILEIVKKSPTADVIERKHGKWLEREVIYNDENTIKEWQSAYCSSCGRYHTTPYMYYFDNYNFCPNCGADMRERREDDND